MGCENGCLNCSTCNSTIRLESFKKERDKYAAISAFNYSYDKCSRPTTVLLGLTNRCNLKCTYCFVHQNNTDMTYETAEKAVEWAINNAKIKKEDKDITINFFGGEPLLKFEEIIKPLVLKYKNIVQFNITTNGTLLDENKVDFLYNNNIGVLLSFDGVAEVQNKQRDNSFFSVLNNIPYLLLRMPETVMRATVTKNSIPFLFKTVKMAEELGFKKIVFCPNAYENWDKEDEKELYNQFKDIGCYVYNKLMNSQNVIQIDPLNNLYKNVNLALNNNLYFNNNIMRCGLGTTTCAITPNEEIIPCQEKISNPSIILGKLDTGIDSKIHKEYLIDYFNKVNNLECDKGCSLKEQLNCLADICPSRMEDLNYNFSSSSCAFTRTTTKVANRLHYLCANNLREKVRKYFQEE